jgi:hypothetical protein
MEVSGPPSRGVVDKETRTNPRVRKRLWWDLKARIRKAAEASPAALCLDGCASLPFDGTVSLPVFALGGHELVGGELQNRPEFRRFLRF